MASRIPSTRENPKGTPTTPVLDPEEILRRTRASLWQTSSAAQEATSKKFGVEESSSTVACEDLITGDSMKDELNSDLKILIF